MTLQTLQSFMGTLFSHLYTMQILNLLSEVICIPSP